MNNSTIRCVLHAAATLVAFVIGVSHLGFEGVETIVGVVVALVSGCAFGAYTCHAHLRATAIWVALAVFALLHMLHSMVDGFIIATSTLGAVFGILMHEVPRQYVQYVSVGSLLEKGSHSGVSRSVIAICLVTGMWAIGLLFAHAVGDTLSGVPWVHVLVEYALFIFVGDSIHHTIEEYRKVQMAQSCCHR